MRSLILLPVIFSVLMLGGCGGRQAGEPPNIRYGREVCSECGMMISESRFAAASADRDNHIFKFDEIGCMILHKLHHPVPIREFWVHDDLSGEWLRAEEAVYVESKQLISPMGYGVAAFSSPKRAKEAALKQGGAVKSFDDLTPLVQEKLKHSLSSVV